MKRTIFLSVAVVIASCLFVYTSCKKITHPTNPTPEKYRLLSYTKITTQTILIPLTPTPIVTENYRFVYDGSNRVSAIFFTSNDSNKVHKGLANLKIAFLYTADSIYKVSTDLNTSHTMETDTFLQNVNGQIVHAYFPNEVHDFTYYGSLLSNETVTYRDSNTTMQINFTYTSDRNNFLNRLYNGQITVTFPDSGIVPYMAPPPYNFRDTNLTFPIDVTYNTIAPDLTPGTFQHLGYGNKTDVINGYFMDGITVDAVDANGDKIRTGYFPAGIAAKMEYLFYDEQLNRPGDYLQIESFTIYGVDLYPNTKLFYSTTSPYNTTRVSYDIDAESKIGHISATTKDSVLKNLVNVQYALQYETK